MTARKILWNIAAMAVGVVIGLWLFLRCFLWQTDRTPRAFDRCVVSHMVAIAGIALLVGVVVLVLRKKVVLSVRRVGAPKER